MKNHNLRYEKKKLENTFDQQKLTVHTTYHEFKRYFLGALENDDVEEFRDKLIRLVKFYPYHLMAWRFLAQTYIHLGNHGLAIQAYEKVLVLFDREKAGRGAQLMIEEIRSYAYELNHDLLREQVERIFSLLYPEVEESDLTSSNLEKDSIGKEQLLDQAKKLFTSSDFEKSVNKYLEFEEKYGYSGPQFSIWIINSARGAHKDELIIKYAVKGLENREINYKDQENILLMSLHAFRRLEKWELMKNFVGDYLDSSEKPQKSIMRSYIECNLKLGDYDGSTAALESFLTYFPNDKATQKLQNQLAQHIEHESTIDIESIPDEMIPPDPTDMMPSKNPADMIPLGIAGNFPFTEEKMVKYKIFALQSLYKSKDKLKLRNYFWDSKRGSWWKEIQYEEIENEKKWLTENIYEGHFYGTIEASVPEVEAIKTKMDKESKEKSLKLQEYLVDKTEDIINLRQEIDKELDFELKQTRAYEISPMLRADVIEHKFQDPKIIEQGNQPTVDDADRLLRDADRELIKIIENQGIMFPLYGKYLEAARAYSELPTDDYEDFLYQRALGRYASLRAGGFFDEFKKEVLKKESSIEKVQKLKDSASSYYYEALRLKLDTEKKKMNPGFEIAEEVVLNYLKLNAISFYIKNNVSIEKSHFKDNYLTTAKNLFNKNGEKVLAETLLNIGAANPENFTSIFSERSARKKLLKGHPFEVLMVNKLIFDQMGKLIGKEFKRDAINTSLKSFFDELSKIRYDNIEKQFLALKDIQFNPRDIQQLQNELSPVLDKPNKLIYTQTDISTLDKMNELISIYEPYLKSTPEQRTAIIIHLKDELIDIRNSIDNHPTYLGLVQFKPNLDNWLKSIENQESMKTRHLQPKLQIILDPESIILTEDGGELTIGVENTGAASATELECNFKLSLKNKELINETEKFDIDELKPGIKDSFTFGFEPRSVQLLKDQYFDCEIIVTGKFLGDRVKTSDNYTINIQTAIPIDIDDIPWHETNKVPPHMFMGRDDIIKQFTRHYLSKDRTETWILYGLTRHGKSSIHQYLAKSLLQSDPVETDQHGKMKIIPFNWNFGEAADAKEIKDFWYYLVCDTIIASIEKYVSDGIITDRILIDPVFKKLKLKDLDERRFKAIDLRRILNLLVQYNYLAFIAVDEFTFYKQMIDEELIKPSFLASIRKLTIEDELACFIFAGVYDLVELIKDESYGITSQFANTREYKVEGIDKKYSEELIRVMDEKLVFTDDAVKLIQLVTNNIPYFIQIVCRRCGKYAVSKKKNVMGLPDVEKVIKFMSGEKEDPESDIAYKIIRLEPGLFQDTQFRPGEPYSNALISTIACGSIDGDGTIRQISADRSLGDITAIWGSHRWSDKQNTGLLGLFQGKLQETIETLEKRGVIIQTKTEAEPFYSLSVDLFRRWWNVEYPDLESELDKLIQKD